SHAGDTCLNLFGSDPLAYRTEQQQRCLCVHPSVRHSRVWCLEHCEPDSFRPSHLDVHTVAPGSGHNRGPQLRLAGSGCLVHHHPKAAKSSQRGPRAGHRPPTQQETRPSSESIPFSRERSQTFPRTGRPILSSIVSSLSLADCGCNCNCKPNRFVSCVFGP
ncbi:hypothetical protein QBC32DRAFT_187400, partial [Pseudoneurospora amorphoporcata]